MPRHKIFDNQLCVGSPHRQYNQRYTEVEGKDRYGVAGKGNEDVWRQVDYAIRGMLNLQV